MKPNYLQPDTSSRDRWMISYLDVLTILLIFFVALTAKSLEKAEPAATPPPVETKKIEIVPQEPAPNPLRAEIQQKLEHYGLNWHAEPRGLAISLPQAVLFAAGKAQINAAALPMIGDIADVLRDIPNRISLDGHADPVPIHNAQFNSNWELAAARSLSLLNLLTTRYELAESRFSISSYSSNDPRSPNDTPDGRANNRRVEILILDEAPLLPASDEPGAAAATSTAQVTKAHPDE